MMLLGGKVREPFRPRDGRNTPAVEVRHVLCWWCRTMHSPAEVETCMALPRKPSANGTSGSSSSSVLVPGLLQQYSEIWAFLVTKQWPDGGKRQTGRLSLSCDADMLALAFTDDETGQYACLNGRNLDELLIEAELRLSEATMPWRPSRYSKKGK